MDELVIEQVTEQVTHDLSTAQSIIVLRSDGETLDVEMLAPNGQDMDNPACFFAAWLAGNWELLNKMCQVAYTNFRDSQNADVVTDAVIKPPTQLVGADGAPIHSEP